MSRGDRPRNLARRRRAAPAPQPSRQRNALTTSMVAAMIDSIDAAGRDEAVRVIVISAAGDHFCSGFDIVSRNADDGTPAARSAASNGACRRRPTGSSRSHQHADAGGVPVCRDGAAGIGLNLALAADFADRRPTTPGSGCRSSIAASRPTAAPRGCCRVASASCPRTRHAAAGRGWSRRRRRRAGGWSTGSCPPPSSTGDRRRARRPARPAPDRRARAHEVAAEQRARDSLLRTTSERGVCDGAVVAERRLPRRPQRVPGTPRSRFRGSVSRVADVRTTR